MRSNTKRMTLVPRKKLAAVPEKYPAGSRRMHDQAGGGNPAPLSSEGDARQAHLLQDTASMGTTTSGQVLNTGKDFVIIDFQGEPASPAQ